MSRDARAAFAATVAVIAVIILGARAQPVPAQCGPVGSSCGRPLLFSRRLRARPSRSLLLLTRFL